MSEQFVKQQSGWSAVPNGLWTADLTHGAKCLLGWLHSHESSYLAALGVNRCEREFGGGGQCRVWLRELTDAGFLATSQENGRYTITLLSEPWQALHKRDGNRRDGNRRGTATETDAVGATVSAPIENQCLEDHSVEHHPPRSPASKRTNRKTPSSSTAEVDETFEAWWKLYPKKKAGKGQARARWRKMTIADRLAAMLVIPMHVAWWNEHETAEQFIPAGDVWLNQRRWEDEQPRVRALQTVAPGRGVFAEMYREMSQTENEDGDQPMIEIVR